MAKAFGEAEAATLTHPEWLALLLDRELADRHDKKLAARLRHARLRQNALVEDVDTVPRAGSTGRITSPTSLNAVEDYVRRLTQAAIEKLTARTKYRGLVKRKLVPVAFTDPPLFPAHW